MGDSVFIFISTIMSLIVFFLATGPSTWSTKSRDTQINQSYIWAANSVPSGRVRQVHQKSLNDLRKYDPAFDSVNLRDRVKQWVEMYENGIAEGNILPLRPYMSDALYNSLFEQLTWMKNAGQRRHTKDLYVEVCILESWRRDGDNEYMNVWVSVKKRMYITKIEDESILLKNKPEDVFRMESRWQLIRSAGNLTGVSGVRQLECPKCGAFTPVSQSGTCRYCGATLLCDTFDWVINKIDSLDTWTL